MVYCTRTYKGNDGEIVTDELPSGISYDGIGVLIVHGGRCDAAYPSTLWIDGCFIKGDETYDTPLATYLAEEGFIVIRARFSTCHYGQALTDLKCIYENVMSVQFKRWCVIGISSGAYLSYITNLSVHKSLNPKLWVGFCPVLNVQARCEEFTDSLTGEVHHVDNNIVENQLSFFGSFDVMDELDRKVNQSDITPICFNMWLRGDGRAPMVELKHHIHLYMMEDMSHAAICANPPDKYKRKIASVIANNVLN